MRRLAAVLVAILTVPVVVVGQTGDDDGAVAAGPFDLRVGLQDGALAVELDADSALPLRDWGGGLLLYAAVRADGMWTSDVDQTPSFAISLRPGLAVQAIARGDDGAPRTSGGWLHAYADARYRAVPARQEGASDGDAPAFLSQLLVGGGLELRAAPVPLWLAGRWRLASVPEAPRLSITWYDVAESSLPTATLPADLALDVWQARAQLELPIPLLCTEIEPAGSAGEDDPFGDVGPPPRRCGLRFYGEAVSTFDTGRATEWLAEAALAWFIDERWAPVVRYRSGAEHGLEYDALLLLGLLLRL
ncbi:MAG: hypothetical protein ACN0LA_14170 [Candidatus Longimicrobiales bacterium M2_2A_002]